MTYKKLILEMLVLAIRERTGLLTTPDLIKGKFDSDRFDFTYRAHGHGIGWVDRSGYISCLTGHIVLEGEDE